MTARATYSPTGPRPRTVSDTVADLAELHDRIVRKFFWDDVTSAQQARLESAARSIRYAIGDLVNVAKGWDEVAACACGAKWTHADLEANPNAADEHECEVR